MAHTNKNIALLIFGRTVAEEAFVKNFASGKSVQLNNSIAKSLYQKTKLLGSNSGLNTFYSLSNEQKGDHFGEKLSNEVDKVFSLGYEKLIIIGTDCPELSQKQITEAVLHLETSSEAIIGPAKDQGSYLIGIHSNNYDRAQFENLPWQSKSLLSVWNQLFPNTYFLEELTDIDSADDLKAFLKDKNTEKTYKRLLFSLLIIKHHHYFNIIRERRSFLLTLFFRGPPLFA